jgi:2'-5' RNA ligase
MACEIDMVRLPADRLPSPCSRAVGSKVRHTGRSLADAITGGLVSALDDLRRVSPSHHYYAPANIHLTILNLDAIRIRFRTEIDLIQAVRSIVASCSSFEITAIRLNVSPHTVFTRVLPEDDTLSHLRKRIAALSPTHARHPWIVHPMQRLRRRFALANVVRFSGVVTPAFAVAISRWREATFGRGIITELELVRTDRLLSTEGTEVIARMSLGRRVT